jgi:PhnB protein
MVNDVMRGMRGPKEFGGSPASLWVYVDDADAIFNRAIEAGAQLQMPVDNQFWGDRAGAFADPCGYTWWVATRKEDLTLPEIQERAAEFFKQMAQAR